MIAPGVYGTCGTHASTGSADVVKVLNDGYRGIPWHFWDGEASPLTIGVLAKRPLSSAQDRTGCRCTDDTTYREALQFPDQRANRHVLRRRCRSEAKDELAPAEPSARERAPLFFPGCVRDAFHVMPDEHASLACNLLEVMHVFRDCPYRFSCGDLFVELSCVHDHAFKGVLAHAAAYALGGRQRPSIFLDMSVRESLRLKDSQELPYLFMLTSRARLMRRQLRRLGQVQQLMILRQHEWPCFGQVFRVSCPSLMAAW